MKNALAEAACELDGSFESRARCGSYVRLFVRLPVIGEVFQYADPPSKENYRMSKGFYILDFILWFI
jgi:hypothetical protein